MEWIVGSVDKATSFPQLNPQPLLQCRGLTAAQLFQPTIFALVPSTRLLSSPGVILAKARNSSPDCSQGLCSGAVLVA